MYGKILLSTLALSFMFSGAAMANLSPQEIRERLEVRADTYLLDESGKRIVSGPGRTNYWRLSEETGELTGDWSSSFDGGFIGMRQKWRVTDEGEIKVTLEEHSAQDKNRSLQGLIERKEFTLTNFESIVWQVKNIKDKRYVVRYIPSLREIKAPIAVDSLPVAGWKVTISDNAGYLWADGAEFNGKYVGIRTHRGTIALSYVPFAGAKEMGRVEGNEMILNVDKKFRINLKSETSFLPAGVTAKVYAVYLPGKKNEEVNSISTWDSNKEDRIQAALKR